MGSFEEPLLRPVALLRGLARLWPADGGVQRDSVAHARERSAFQRQDALEALLRGALKYAAEHPAGVAPPSTATG